MVCGIIAEYNPFHNGHKYQLDLIKKSYEAIVVIMSGSFTQRGDTAITDKWSRAKSALVSGADLVIELPTVYAMNTAERFAFGGISLLDSLGVVDAVSFGSECGDISLLKSASETLISETEEEKEEILRLLKSGKSYAAAREEAFSDKIPSEILSSPNNILAVEYIKHLKLLKSSITPVTHMRVGGGYSSHELDSSLASATAIRENYDRAEIESQMPENVYEIFKNSSKHFLANLDTAAVSFIRSQGPDALKNSLECVEGIENRIYNAAKNLSALAEIENICCTKRYTRAKIRRIILCSMLSISGDMSRIKPDYARILGATEKGRQLLSEIKEKSSLTLITKAADFKGKNILFEKDCLATDIWALSSYSGDKKAGMDFTTSPIML